MLRRTIGLGITGSAIATAYSAYDNDFNIDSVGIVRFSQAAITVSIYYIALIVVLGSNKLINYLKTNYRAYT